MTLYHYTSRAAWQLIQQDGFIRPTESNIGSARPDWPPMGDRVGPDVVWLTDQPAPNARALALQKPPAHVLAALEAQGNRARWEPKTQVRIRLDLQDGEAEPWRTFCTRHGIHRQWRRALERGRAPATWYVLPRSVALDEIVDATILDA